MCRHTLCSWCGWSDPSLGLCDVVTNWGKVYIGLLLPLVLTRGRHSGKQLLSDRYFHGKAAWLEDRPSDACSGSALDLSTVSMAGRLYDMAGATEQSYQHSGYSS
jgi:hypothetical protein